MAIINPTIERSGDGSVLVYTFSGLNSTDTTGAAIPAAEWADRTVQVTGTFDTSTVVWEGSNDGTNYVTLTDPQGNACSFTAAGLEQVIELTQFARPRVTAGGASTDLTVIALCRRPNNMRT